VITAATEHSGSTAPPPSGRQFKIAHGERDVAQHRVDRWTDPDACNGQYPL